MNQRLPPKCEGCGIMRIVHLGSIDGDILCASCMYRSETELHVWDGYVRYADKSTKLFKDTLFMCQVASSTLQYITKYGE